MNKHSNLSLLGAALLFSLFISIAPLAVSFAHASPLTISSCNDLEKIASSSYPLYTTSASYVLTQNINCSITATQNSDGGSNFYGFAPIPDFTGTFNGAGYTISNLYIYRTGASNVGLFQSLDGTSTVENLHLTGGSITGAQYVGAIAGKMYSSATIMNVTSSVPVSDPDGELGGLVGKGDNASSTIASSSDSAVVTISDAYQDIGGIAGYFTGTIQNASTSGMIIGQHDYEQNVGGIVGNNLGLVTNSYSSESIQMGGGDNNDNIGGLVGANQNLLQNSYFTGMVNASTTNGVDSNIGGVVGAGTSGVTNTYYNTDTAYVMGAHRETPFGIYGTQFAAWAAGNYAPLSFSTYFPSTDSNGYYDIPDLAHLEDLLAFVYTDLSADKFKITAPISLPTEFYIPQINALEFNGGNNPITNLNLSRLSWTGNDPAFIGNVVSGTTLVTDMDLVGVNVTGNVAGGIVNNLDGILSNSTVSGSVSGNDEVGGAVANMDNSYDAITNVQSTATVSGIADSNGDDVYYVGGLLGYGAGSVSNSSASSTISVAPGNSSYIGGLIGYSDAVVSTSSANVLLTASGAYEEDIGGLIGYTTHPVSGSYAAGSLIASGDNDADIGGLIGNTGSQVTDSYAMVNMVASGDSVNYVGGLLGESQSAITNTYATGSVTANGVGANEIGGLVGSNDNGDIASSSATGNVTALGTDSEYLGGLVGISYGALSNSYATGNVIGTSTSEYMGGFDGEVDSGSISECYATGAVTGNSEIGGLTGITYGPVSESFATGNIDVVGTGAEDIGGFVGYIDASPHDNYATGNILIDSTASSTVGYFGGFAGEIEYAVYNAYSTGNVLGSVYGSAGGYAGGFVGYNNGGAVINSYSTGAGSVITSLAGNGGGYFIGDTNDNQLQNDAQYYQGTPAIGFDTTAQTYGDALLATYGYGTDDHTLSNFYKTTEPVYDQGQSGAWDFSTIWVTHTNTFPTFLWYSGPSVQTPPTTPPSQPATSGGGSSSGGTVANQISNLLQNGNTAAAAALEQQYPNLVSPGTRGAASTTPSQSCTTNLYPTKPIKLGAQNDPAQVTLLQKYLNTYEGTNLPVDGIYSAQDADAVIAWQEKYAAVVLTPWHITKGTGYIYKTSLDEFKSLFLAQCQNSGSQASTAQPVTQTTTQSATNTDRDLQLGMTGDDVRALQEMLIAKNIGVAAKALAKNGATGYFGNLTKAALIEFQKSAGITPAAGYYGSITRKYIGSE